MRIFRPNFVHEAAKQHALCTSVESTQDRCVLTFPLVLISALRAMQLVLLRMDMYDSIYRTKLCATWCSEGGVRAILLSTVEDTVSRYSYNTIRRG